MKIFRQAIFHSPLTTKLGTSVQPQIPAPFSSAKQDSKSNARFTEAFEPAPIPSRVRYMDPLLHDDFKPESVIKAERIAQKYAHKSDELPTFHSMRDFRAFIARTCGELKPGPPGEGPVMFLGETHGLRASIAAVDESLKACARVGIKVFAVENVPDDAEMVREYEGVARSVIRQFGGYRPGLMDAVSQEFVDHTKKKDAQRNLISMSDDEYQAFASEMVGAVLLIVMARDAGFRVMLMDHPLAMNATIADREQHMRTFLRRLFERQKHDPSLGNGALTFTGGLHVAGLLSAMEHGNYRSAIHFNAAGKAAAANPIRRHIKQGTWEDFRSRMVMLSGDAVTGDPLSR